MERKNSSLSQGLLWLGAAVSIAEIITGTLLAPLGMNKGIIAIIIGHIIGGIILFMAGLIGSRGELSSAKSITISFGKMGSIGFSIINVIQLIGWTAVMIISGATAFNSIVSKWGVDNPTLWKVIIGVLILAWVAMGSKNLNRINYFIVSLLFICTLYLGATIFMGGNPVGATGEMSFGLAIELNVAMSLSWMPLIADYTRTLKKPMEGTVVSVIAYIIGSAFMYIIGLGAAIYTGISDINQVLVGLQFGVVALLIVVLSTVTTTFLDVFSAGVCLNNISEKFGEKTYAVAIGIVGTVLAIFVTMSQYESFLLFIGSVFAPMFAILFVDYYVFNNTQIKENTKRHWVNIGIWVIGFIAYRFMMTYSTPVGITLPIMMGTALLTVIVGKTIKS